MSKVLTLKDTIGIKLTEEAYKVIEDEYTKMGLVYTKPQVDSDGYTHLSFKEFILAFSGNITKQSEFSDKLDLENNLKIKIQ